MFKNIKLIFEAFEKSLGNPKEKKSICSFSHSIMLDEQDLYPQDACDWLDEWGLNEYYVPSTLGGRLKSFEEVFFLLRAISRRDLTVAVAHSKTYLGVIAVWIAGDEELKHLTSKIILNKGKVALGLTERAHGADLLANEVIGTDSTSPEGFFLSGEKWLINNATKGQAMVLFARTAVNGGVRGFSLFMVDKSTLATGTFVHLPKIKTHGIRGADISGIRFNKAWIPRNNMIGKRGAGLEITLRALQVTRTLCAGFSLGGVDTALRLTLDFTLKRSLYGGTVYYLSYPKRLLTDAFLDILICECLSISAMRALHYVPHLMSVWSSVIKYFVPTTIDATLQNLAIVLGARYYLREDHHSGIFQKILRDSAIVALFDGSTIVNLELIALQLPSLLKNAITSEECTEVLEHIKPIFSLTDPLPLFTPESVAISALGKDVLLSSLRYCLAKITQLKTKQDIEVQLLTALESLILEILNQLETILNYCKNEKNKALFLDKTRLSPEFIQITKQFCTLYAAIAIVNIWLYNRSVLDDYACKSSWVILCLLKLLRKEEIFLSPELINYCYQEVDSFLMERFNQHKLFSICSFSLVPEH